MGQYHNQASYDNLEKDAKETFSPEKNLWMPTYP